MNSQRTTIGRTWVDNHIESQWLLLRILKQRNMSFKSLTESIQNYKDKQQQFYGKQHTWIVRRLFSAWRKQTSLVIVGCRKLATWRNKPWQGIQKYFSAWHMSCMLIGCRKFKQEMSRVYRSTIIQECFTRWRTNAADLHQQQTNQIKKHSVSVLRKRFLAWRSIVSTRKIKQRIMFWRHRIASMQQCFSALRDSRLYSCRSSVLRTLPQMES